MSDADEMSIRLIIGDCRQIMPGLGPFDMILADPPYGDTSLAWDRRVDGWLEVARDSLKPSGSMWLFGSMRLFMTTLRPKVGAIIWHRRRGLRAQVCQHFMDRYDMIKVILFPAPGISAAQRYEVGRQEPR